jgi:aromatic ring-cleaving dioxygenase
MEIVSWFSLNRDGLDVLVHPNTGDALGDHRDRAVWVGKSYELDLSMLG